STWSSHSRRRVTKSELALLRACLWQVKTGGRARRRWADPCPSPCRRSQTPSLAFWQSRAMRRLAGAARHHDLTTRASVRAKAHVRARLEKAPLLDALMGHALPLAHALQLRHAPELH